MRSLFLSILCALTLALPASADIDKPATINDTLDLLLERVLPTFPDARINRAAQNIVTDAAGDSVINPDNIHAVLQSIDDGGEREQALDAFATTMMAAMTEPARDPADFPLDRIYPVLRHASFAQSSGDGGISGTAINLYYEPYVGDMIKLYAIDYPDRVSYVTRDDMQAASVTQTALDAAAWDNFNAKLDDQLGFDGGDGAFMAILDGFYESSTVLDTTLWASLSDQFGDDIVMIVPARDLVVFGPASNAETIKFLNSMRINVLENGTHQLSDLMYIWRDEAWQVFEN